MYVIKHVIVVKKERNEIVFTLQPEAKAIIKQNT